MYSCEIDLGFCGGLRGAATVLADDPIFGRSCYGGEWKQKGDAVTVDSADGVSRRFHIVNDSGRLHCKIGKGHFVQEGSFVITGNVLEARIDPCGVKGAIPLEISSEGFGACTVSVNGTVLGEGESVKISLPEQMGPAALSVKFCKPLLP